MRPILVLRVPIFVSQVWNESDEVRIVLLIDLWHPGLSEEQKSSLRPLPFSSSSSAASAVLDVAGEWVVTERKEV